MENWLQIVISQYGYWGIFLLIGIENIFPPIPSEVILTFGGFLTTYTKLEPWLVILAATAGSIFGAMILYGAGRILPPKRLESWLSGKLGRMLGFHKGDIEKAAQWFEKKGKYTVFFCRCIPIVRSLISIPAGMASMRMLPFLSMTIAGTLIWNTLLVFLGTFAGNAWGKIAGYFDVFSTVTLFILVAVAFGVLLLLLKRKKKS